MATYRADKVTAQVAVEAIVSDPTAYDDVTIVYVKAHATAVGVSEFYLDMLPDVFGDES